MGKKPAFSRTPKKAGETSNPKKDDLKNFDPNIEFKDDESSYDIQYYQNAIFLQRGTKDEIKYPYLISGFTNICPIESDLKGLSPFQLSQNYLNKDLLPALGKKTRDYFESILIETRSVEIQHIERAHKEFAFSKLIIKRVLLAHNWGLPLFQGRQLNTYQAIPNFYNYFDYVKAWENIFLYENSQQKHSWWIKFNLNDNEQKIPTWFSAFFFTWGVISYDISQKWQRLLFTYY